MKAGILRNTRSVQALALMVVLGTAGVSLSAQEGAEVSPPTATLPAGILPDSPLAQVVRLVQSGVDESIILTYITNSPGTFNLDSDKIIYLKDAGVPNNMVQAMMQHDATQKSMIVTTQSPPPPAPTVAPTDDSTEAPTAPVTVEYFYNNLAPYGNWVEVSGYGRCWQPGVSISNHDWQPYGDHGHWVYTDAGWYWVSDYSWGWAPFHYGRWFRHDRFGWCWTPDTVWGPSWVTWRYDNDYCGWAPLPPRSYYREGAGFFYNGQAVGVGFDFGLGANAFVFVGIHDFGDPHPFRHRVERGRMEEIYHRTAEVNHFDHDNHGFINHGIDPGRITSVTHVPIHPLPIRENPSSGGHFTHGEQVSHGAVYVNRPETRRNGETDQLNRNNNNINNNTHNNFAPTHNNNPGPVNQPHSIPNEVNHDYHPPEQHPFQTINPGQNHPPEVNHPFTPAPMQPMHPMHPQNIEPQREQPHAFVPPPESRPIQPMQPMQPQHIQPQPQQPTAPPQGGLNHNTPPAAPSQPRPSNNNNNQDQRGGPH
jgi:hypothetical protein